MRVKTLHLCPDDKFYKGFIDNQQQFTPDTINIYIIVSNSRSIHQEKRQENVLLCNTNEIISRLMKWEYDFDQVIFHSLPTLFRRKFLPIIPHNVIVTWLFYGYEYYHRREVILDYLSPITKSYYNSIRNPQYSKLYGQRIMDWVKNRAVQFGKDLQRVDRFAHWNEEEFTLIRNRYNLSELKYIPFSIGINIPKIVKDDINRYILIGHSGALTVNHLDGIQNIPEDWVEKFDRIVIPFSYGANRKYEAIVRKLTHKKWGGKVLIITKYINPISYFNLLSRVKLAYMPQLRPSGAGNIRFLLQNNIPVVMEDNSILTSYYRRMGVRVFGKDFTSQKIPRLSDSDKITNHNFLAIYRGEERLRFQYKTLLMTY